MPTFWERAAVRFHLPPSPLANLSESQRQELDRRTLLDLKIATWTTAAALTAISVVSVPLDYLYFPYPQIALAVRCGELLGLWAIAIVVSGRVHESRWIPWINRLIYLLALIPILPAMAIRPDYVSEFEQNLVALAILIPMGIVEHIVWAAIVCGAAVVLCGFGSLKGAAYMPAEIQSRTVAVAFLLANAARYFLWGGHRQAVLFRDRLRAVEEILQSARELVERGLAPQAEVYASQNAILARPNPSRIQFLANLVMAGHLTRYQGRQAALGRVEELIVGHYLLLEQLGVGGVGRVFRAVHRQTRQVVALKRLRGRSAGNETAVTRFFREYGVGMELRHPHIVTMLDFEDVGGSYWLVMEYVDGTDLGRVLRRRTLSPAQTRRIALEVAEALDCASRHNVLHRDISPSNILLTADGTVKVTDFGLARLEPQETGSLTETGLVMGSLDYISPEQARSASDLDSRSDLYSLGCMMYRMLTGRPPFADAPTPLDKLQAHSQQAPRPLQEIDPTIPASLYKAVHRLLAKDPARRYATARELIAALNELGDLPGDERLVLDDGFSTTQQPIEA